MAQPATFNGNYNSPPLQKDFTYTSDIVLPALVAFVSFGLVSEVATPVLGSVVRLQAHYSPLVRVVQTNEVKVDAAKAVPPTRPTSIFSMIRLVKNKEGWAGLHRGLWPYLTSNLIIPAVAGMIMRWSVASAPTTYQQVVGRAALRLTLISIATTILTLPFTVFINRSVAHPGKVPTSPLKAARVVLTPYERSSPLALYKAPGLLAAVFLKAVWSTVVVNGLKALVAVQLLETQREGGGLWIVGFAAFQALSTYILCPLSVVVVRLSIQKQNGSPSLPSTTQEKVETVAPSSEESVISLRGDEKPYTGLVNAFRTIKEEEGTGKLYSAWGMTLFSALLETFV
ncbi:hypothetical protein BDY24DRAFT_398382 [Mrakia frigida]|uniref:uncharacterized protein n=1 Tax=Mrakia frigida TaxID=29902 RepID=UPI003FCC00D0